MQLTAKVFNLLNNVISFTLFAGLFLVATFSLISLSPISYEDYSAYQQGIENYYSAQDAEQGEVAGVLDQPQFHEVEYTNLLDRRYQQYRFATDDTSAELHLGIVTQRLEINEKETLGLVRIKNNSPQTKEFIVDLAYAAEPGIVYSLLSEEHTIDQVQANQFVMSIRPYSMDQISLGRSGDAGQLEKDFSLSLLIKDNSLEQQIIETDGGFLDELP